MRILLLPAIALMAGCALVDQTTFNPDAGKKPVFAAPAAPPAPPPVDPAALLTIPLPRAGDIAPDVAKAVAAARAAKPDVTFDVVEIVGEEPGANVGADAAAVARMIEARGVPASRVRLAARPTLGPVRREVRVYVR